MAINRPIPSLEEIWRRYDADERRLTASVSERMLELAGLRPGMNVLDLATGRGEPAITAARRVGPAGKVLGVDSSAEMLAMARERAESEGIENLELRAGDAATLAGVPPGHFDAALSRWGLMYFDAPVAALAAARRALAPGGVLVAAVWAEPARAPYFAFPRRVLAKFAPVPPLDPEAPGTFRYADMAELRRNFAAAGFAVTSVEEMEIDVMEARTDAELIAWTRAFGMTRLLNDLPEETQRAWETDLAEEAGPLWKDGRVRLGGVTRLVTASALE